MYQAMQLVSHDYCSQRSKTHIGLLEKSCKLVTWISVSDYGINTTGNCS